MNNENVGLTNEQVDRLVLLLTRSTAIWKNPELLNKVSNFSSPSAVSQDLQVSGTKTAARKIRLQARWFKMAIREFGGLQVQVALEFLANNKNSLKLLKDHLKASLSPTVGNVEHHLKERNANSNTRKC